MITNPYKILGVPDGTPEDECAKAYKRLAKKYHPDLNPNDAYAAEKMAEINAAYDMIKNGDTIPTAPYTEAGSQYRENPFEGQSDYRRYDSPNGNTYYYTHTYTYPQGERGKRRSCLGRIIRFLFYFYLIRAIISAILSFMGLGIQKVPPRHQPDSSYSQSADENGGYNGYFGADNGQNAEQS